MMTNTAYQLEARVAVMVDCDNVDPEILEYALAKAEEYGRVVLRRGYGNKETLAHKWQELLIRHAFTPHLQFHFVQGKNTGDIAFALDTLEAHVDGRADTFVLVTSDSDFTYLCRKLRERGATAHVVGESKTPKALRYAGESFFEWTPPAAAPVVPIETARKQAAAAAKPGTQPAKSQPRMIIDAIIHLAQGTADGEVGLSALGNYLKETNHGFSSNKYGHASLSKMLQSYASLKTTMDANGHWTVALIGKPPKSAA